MDKDVVNSHNFFDITRKALKIRHSTHDGNHGYMANRNGQPHKTYLGKTRSGPVLKSTNPVTKAKFQNPTSKQYNKPFQTWHGPSYQIEYTPKNDEAAWFASSQDFENKEEKRESTFLLAPKKLPRLA